jgi:hypothetical protein
VIADLLRIGRTRPNYVPDDTVLQLRLLVRFRWSLADRIGDTKRSLLAVLDRGHPRTGTACSGGCCFVPHVVGRSVRAAQQVLHMQRAAASSADRQSPKLPSNAGAALIKQLLARQKASPHR